MKLLFFRHGQTAVNATNRMHHRNDEAGLDETGREQARKIANVCRKEGVEVIYSSPELRAQETAVIVAESMGLEVSVIPGLAERDWGDWSYLAWDEIKMKLETMTLAERYTFVPPNGESWEAMDKRLEESLYQITRNGFEITAIVTHGGALRALMPILKREPKESSFRYDFLNASLTEFVYEGGKFIPVVENNSNHLG